MEYLQFLFIIFAVKAKLGFHLAIAAYFDIVKHINIKEYLNIAKRNFESIKMRKRDGGWKVSKIQFRKVFDNSLFLLIRPGSVMQAPPLQTKEKPLRDCPNGLNYIQNRDNL